MRALKFIIILFVVAATTSCKEDTLARDDSKITSALDNKTLTKTIEPLGSRISLGKTGLSLISERPFLFDSKTSSLTGDDKISYTYKECYYYETSSGSYALINYSLAKDDIQLSLTGGIEGALENLATTVNATIENRVDTNLGKTIGHPALFSKGLAKSRNPGSTSIEYRVLITNNNQQLYMVIGIFPPNDSKEIKAFEEMIETIQIN